MPLTTPLLTMMAYAAGVALFKAIMGNALAALPVTVGAIVAAVAIPRSRARWVC